jgi:Ribulose-phosphate 3 epimerase family
VKDIAAAGGKSYTFHLEATGTSFPSFVSTAALVTHPTHELSDDPMDVVRQIKATGMRAAVAINPGTPSSEISNELGNAVDMILVMTVWPGAGGQKFIAECMPKVAELRARFPELDVEVDGGVGPKTIDKCADAGECPASLLCSCSRSRLTMTRFDRRQRNRGRHSRLPRREPTRRDTLPAHTVRRSSEAHISPTRSSKQPHTITRKR